MTAIYYTIGISYIAYYTSNIVYDLFFKNEKNKAEDQSIEVSIKDLVENKVETVSIDDVEFINTPTSIETISKEVAFDNNTNEPDLDALRRRFEAEEKLDFPEKNSVTVALTPKKVSEDIQIEQVNDIDFTNLLTDAENHVQMIDNINGAKVYAIINFQENTNH